MLLYHKRKPLITTAADDSHSISAPFLLGGQLSLPNFEKGEQKKSECLGGLKEFLPWIFAWGGAA